MSLKGDTMIQELFERLLRASKPLPKPTALAPAASMLFALNASGKHIYGGTVPQAEVRRRRAANKVARRQRKVNAR